MRYLLLAVAAIVGFGGCAKPDPTRAGGKPVSYWIEALRSSEPGARKEAVFKLGNVGPADPAAYPAVVGSLRDIDPKVRSEAILALMKFGGLAKDAIPLLGELQTRDPSPHVRDRATRALESLARSRDGSER